MKSPRSHDTKRLKKLAAQGDAAAQYQLGLIYAGGRGVQKTSLQRKNFLHKRQHNIMRMRSISLGDLLLRVTTKIMRWHGTILHKLLNFSTQTPSQPLDACTQAGTVATKTWLRRTPSLNRLQLLGSREAESSSDAGTSKRTWC